MADESREILKLLEQGFPCPKLGFDENLDVDYALSGLMASNAVNENDAEFRLQMAESVAQKLLYGESLLAPDRAWLLYILKKIGPGNLPNEARGRPPNSSLDNLAMMCRLGKIMVDLEKSSPGMKTTKRLEKASEILNKSLETIRALYYSKKYKALSAHPFFYRFCVENSDIDK